MRDLMILLLGAGATLAGFILGRSIDILLPRKPRGLVCDDELLLTGTDSVVVAALMPKLRSFRPGEEVFIRKNGEGVIEFPQVRRSA